MNLPPHYIDHWTEYSLIKSGKIFNLKTEDIYKEKAIPVDKPLFYNVSIFSNLSRMIGYKSGIVDLSLKFKVVNKISYWMAKIMTPFSKADLRSDGHTHPGRI